MENYNNTILLPHNQEAFQKVMEHFHSNNRAAVVHATGTGKSYIIAAVVSRFAGKVVIVAPNYFILEESRKLCTDRIEFRTFASLMNDKSPANDYQLICIDEFHRAGADEWGKGVARLLDANPNAKVLGTTATAIRFLDGQRNMADELFDGNVVSSLPLREAIDRGILPEPMYVASLYAFTETYLAAKNRIMESNNKSEEEKERALHKLNGLAHNWKNAKGVGSIMRKYFDGNIKRIVVFCANVKMAAKARNILGPWLATAGFRRMHFYNIDYKEKNVKREMENFQNDDFDGIKVAISVNMLNEGVHVDGVDAVIMMRASVSPNIILQQIGRCLTAKKTEHKPVILDLVNNMNTLGDMRLWKFTETNDPAEKTSTAKDSNEKEFPFRVIDECRDFSALLEDIQCEFDKVTNFYPIFWKFIEENGRLPKQSGKEESSLSYWCRDLFNNRYGLAERFPDVYAKLKEMGFGEYKNIRREKRYSEFWEFIEKYGRLPKNGVKEENSLYQWCGGVWNNKYGLTEKFPDVYAKLKELRWGEDKNIQREKKYSEFWEFIKKNNRLPKPSVKEEKPLYQWCGNVWNKQNGLAERYPEVVTKLEEMGWGKDSDIKTEKRVAEFWEFVEKNERLPRQSVKEENSLYFWCRNVLLNAYGLAERFPDVFAKIKELKEKK